MTEQPKSKLQDEAAGFLNPFKWGKKKEESKADKAQANPPVAEAPTPAPTTTTPTPASTETAAPARTYTVKSGDTLWDIAASYYGDGRQYTKIARANNIPDPNMINIGMTLTIPD